MHTDDDREERRLNTSSPGASGATDSRALPVQLDPGSSALSEMDPAQAERLRTLGILPAADQPPFDIIGDVHGCIAELRELLDRLGYQREGDAYSHPQSRRLIFVGDLEDRGPDSPAVLRLVIASRDAGSALLVIGNHDHKFTRWLRGRHVHIGNGLASTIQQLDRLPQNRRETLRRQAEALFDAAPGYLLLDGGRLVVTHGAILDSMIGHWNEHIASFCLYADVIGRAPDGRPIRRDWGAARDLAAAGGDHAPRIVYGHNPVEQLAWVNRTLDLDTGCVYGGALSALRYPELELCQVPAHHTYLRHKTL